MPLSWPNSTRALAAALPSAWRTMPANVGASCDSRRSVQSTGPVIAVVLVESVSWPRFCAVIANAGCTGTRPSENRPASSLFAFHARYSLASSRRAARPGSASTRKPSDTKALASGAPRSSRTMPATTVAGPAMWMVSASFGRRPEPNSISSSDSSTSWPGPAVARVKRPNPSVVARGWAAARPSIAASAVAASGPNTSASCWRPSGVASILRLPSASRSTDRLRATMRLPTRCGCRGSTHATATPGRAPPSGVSTRPRTSAAAPFGSGSSRTAATSAGVRTAAASPASRGAVAVAAGATAESRIGAGVVGCGRSCQPRTSASSRPAAIGIHLLIVIAPRIRATVPAALGPEVGSSGANAAHQAPRSPPNSPSRVSRMRASPRCSCERTVATGRARRTAIASTSRSSKKRSTNTVW